MDSPVNTHALMTPERQAEFWKHVIRGGENECWHWDAVNVPKSWGSGMFATVKGGPQQSVHRLVFMLTHGRPLKKMDRLIHTCENPKCCNPAHLLEGHWKQRRPKTPPKPEDKLVTRGFHLRQRHLDKLNEVCDVRGKSIRAWLEEHIDHDHATL